MHLIVAPKNRSIAPLLLVGVLASALTGCGHPTAKQQSAPTAAVPETTPPQAAPSAPAPQPAPPVTQAPADRQVAPPANANAPSAAPAPAPAANKFIAYYFHRTLRCPTCLKIEKNAKQAIEKAFSADLKNGRLEWRLANIEEPPYEHFETDFELESSTLVLVEMNGDQVVRWKKLEQVWDLVGDQPKFDQYVQNELRAFMGGAKAAS